MISQDLKSLSPASDVIWSSESARFSSIYLNVNLLIQAFARLRRSPST